MRNNNVFNLFANPKNDFTSLEKTLLDDIAMKFRDKGINARLFIKNASYVPIAQFLDCNTNKLYLSVIRHQDKCFAEYVVSPSMKISESYVNFADVLLSCRTHLEAYNCPAVETILDMQAYRRG